MTSNKVFNPYFFHAQLVKKLIELALLCEDFAQLRVLSEIADLFYSNVDPQFSELYKIFEDAARQLRDTSMIGGD